MISQKKIKKISRNRKSRNTKQAKTEIYEKPPAETPKQAKYEFYMFQLPWETVYLTTGGL